MNFLVRQSSGISTFKYILVVRCVLYTYQENVSIVLHIARYIETYIIFQNYWRLTYYNMLYWSQGRLCKLWVHKNLYCSYFSTHRTLQIMQYLAMMLNSLYYCKRTVHWWMKRDRAPGSRTLGQCRWTRTLCSTAYPAPSAYSFEDLTVLGKNAIIIYVTYLIIRKKAIMSIQ